MPKTLADTCQSIGYLERYFLFFVFKFGALGIWQFLDSVWSAISFIHCCYDIFHFISPLSCALLMIFILLIALCKTLSSTLYTSFEQLFQHWAGHLIISTYIYIHYLTIHNYYYYSLHFNSKRFHYSLVSVCFLFLKDGGYSFKRQRTIMSTKATSKFW